jgi:hypothetical protein
MGWFKRNGWYIVIGMSPIGMRYEVAYAPTGAGIKHFDFL